MKDFRIILSKSEIRDDGRGYGFWVPEDNKIRLTCVGGVGGDFPITTTLENAIIEFEPSFAKQIFEIFDNEFNDGSWQLDPKYQQ